MACPDYSNDKPADAGEIRFVGELARVAYRPGDRFVMTVPVDLTDEQSVRLHERWRLEWADEPAAPRLLIVTGGIRLGVIGPADPETPETGEASA